MSLAWLDFDEPLEQPQPPQTVEEEEDSPKKIYQQIEETARHLGVACSRCTKVEDLFVSDISEKRLKIKDLCEALISRFSPKCYGSCAREKLWKYVFYDAVQRARKLQRDKPWSDLQLAYIKSHLQTGIAQLHFFVMKIQQCSDFEATPLLSHPSSFDGIMNLDMKLIYKSRNVSVDDRKEQKKLVELLAMCFVNMGDLYRYLRDIYSKASANSCEDEADYFYRAQEWYTHAFLMNPSAGLSLNQLGNVYSDRNWGIDSVYYLLYSSATENAYEGAIPNLRQLLDSKMVQFARRPALPEPKPMELLCNGFTRLLFQLLFDESQINYEKFCQETLVNFHERLVSFDPDLDEKLLFKFSAISVMIVWRLQAINSIHTSPAVAFAMSIFFTIVNHLGVILEERSSIQKVVETCSFPCEKDIDQLSTTSSANNKDSGSGDLGEIEQPDCDEKFKGHKKQKRTRGPCRGSRYRSSSIPSLQSFDTDSELDEDSCEGEEHDGYSDYLWSESDSECSDSGDESDDQPHTVEDKRKEKLPDEERNNMCRKAFSSSSSNGRSETSGSGSRENSQKSTEGLKQELFEAIRGGADNQRTIEESSSTGGEKQRVVIDVEDLLKCQSQIEPSLVALTPFIRWIQTYPAVKDALAANAEKVFLEKFCTILTTLASNSWAEVLPNVSKSVKDELIKNWDKLLSKDVDEQVSDKGLFSFQLSEDRSMCGFAVFSNFIDGLITNDELTSDDEFVVRIGRLLSFGMWMNKTESFSMMYSDEDRKFFVPSPEVLKYHMQSSKWKRLLKGTHGSENLNRLTRAYQDMKLEDREWSKGRRDRDRRVRRNRHYSGSDDKNYNGRPPRIRGGGGRRRDTRPTHKRHLDDKPICVVIDLDAALKHTEIIKKLSSNKHFVIYVPHSVFESLDMMKDSMEEMAEVAKDCYTWMDTAVKRNHPGIKILKNTEKKRLNTDYPLDENDIELWEYYEMLECCHFLITTMFEGNPYHYLHSAFGDHRDKFSVFYLSGNDSLLDTTLKRGFDPIKIARSLPGVFVDCISEYPPVRQHSQHALSQKGRKWQTSGKCKG